MCHDARTMRRPLSWKSRYEIRVLDEERLALLDETEPQLLSGAPFGRIAHLLDGARSQEQIVAQCVGKRYQDSVKSALTFLVEAGFLREGTSELSREQAAFWEILGAPDRLPRAPRIEIVELDPAGAEGLRKAVTSLEADAHAGDPLRIAVTDSYLRMDLESYNRIALEQGRPWMLCKLTGVEVWIGPIFIPGRTACWKCLFKRHREVRWFDSVLNGDDPAAVRPPLAYVPESIAAAAAVATCEAVKWVATGSSELGNGIYSLDFRTLRMSLHRVMRRPQCPDCGQPRAAGSRPSLPRSPTKAASLEQHVSGICGVATEIRQEPSCTGPLHLYGAAYVIPVALASRPAEPARAAGSGFSESDAKASCLGEAIERYSAIFQGDEPRRLARYSRLARAAVDPDLLLQISEGQYRDREHWNRQHGAFQYIPEPFDPNAAIEWTRAWSLTNKRTRYVPTAFCYMRYQGPNQACFADTNGCAAGASMEEAILRGFLEIVERDATALWWYNRLALRGVDLASFEDDRIETARAFFERMKRSLHALDLTSDIGIPVIAAISADRRESAVLFGFGAGLSPRQALLRAICELNQVLGGPRRQSKTSQLAAPDACPDRIRWLREACLDNQPYLRPQRRSRTAGEFPNLQKGKSRRGVDVCVELAAARNIEVIVADLSRPEIGIPVAKVICPGLRSAWARFAPGRLYTAPVEMGCLKKPHTENELNPYPFFL